MAWKARRSQNRNVTYALQIDRGIKIKCIDGFGLSFLNQKDFRTPTTNLIFKKMKRRVIDTIDSVCGIQKKGRASSTNGDAVVFSPNRIKSSVDTSS